jgi:hypothetical protein
MRDRQILIDFTSRYRGQVLNYQFSGLLIIILGSV